MNCKLCLESNENSFEIDGAKGIEHNALSILQKHFPFCFENDDKGGHVCQKCWWNVETFHSFYTEIECIYRSLVQSNERVFVQTLAFQHPTDLLAMGTKEIVCSSLKVPTPDEVLSVKSSDDEREAAEEMDDQSPDKPSNKIESPTQSNRTTEPTAKFSVKKTYPKVACEYCKKDVNKYFLAQHIQAVHSVEPHKPIRCTKQGCEKTFISKQLLMKHLREVHMKVKCELCQKDVRKNYLQRHIQAVHSIQLQTVCDLCGKVWKTKEAYKVHYISEHTAQERVQCDICQTWFKNKYRLRYHVLQLHQNTGPVSCTICGHISKNKKALVSHQRIHQEDYKTRFKCDVCGKGCFDKTHLREHSLIHTGITDAYKCSLCDKTFSSSSGLRRHAIVHNEQTVFHKCNYCDKSYHRKSTLHTHVLRSHRVENDLHKMSKELTKLRNLASLKNKTK